MLTAMADIEVQRLCTRIFDLSSLATIRPSMAKLRRWGKIVRVPTPRIMVTLWLVNWSAAEQAVMALQKTLHSNKIRNGNAEGVEEVIAVHTGTDKRNIDTCCGNTSQKINKGCIARRKGAMGNLHQLPAELYSSYADLHCTSH